MTSTAPRGKTFRAEDVRGIVDGRKTMFREVVTRQPGTNHEGIPQIRTGRNCWTSGEIGTRNTLTGEETCRPMTAQELIEEHVRCPYKPGDVLFVKETWCRNHASQILYRADCPDTALADDAKCWKSSIHMPRAASRLTLQIESVRVERLGEISEADARAEGMGFMEPNHFAPPGGGDWMPHDAAFQLYWNAVNGKRAGCDWKESPWVWVVGFRKVEGA